MPAQWMHARTRTRLFQIFHRTGTPLSSTAVIIFVPQLKHSEQEIVY